MLPMKQVGKPISTGPTRYKHPREMPEAILIWIIAARFQYLDQDVVNF